MIEGNTSEAVSFLMAWPARPLALTFIPIDEKGKKGKLETRVWKDPDPVEMSSWIEEHQGKGNIYFAVNPPLDTLGDRKAKRTDVKEIVSWHVDLDPRVGESQEDALLRLEKKLSTYNPKPTFILASGGGVQAFWLLAETIAVNGDLSKAEDLKHYNIHFERALGGDNCHNIDRIMRVPGTINVPDEKKVLKGRKPALSRILWRSGVKYPIGAFVKANKVQETEDNTATVKVTIGGNRASVAYDDERLNPLDTWVKALGVCGDENNKYGGDRSKALFAFVCECVRAKIPDDMIADILVDTDWQISAHILAQKDVNRAIERNISRAKEAANDPDLAAMNDDFAIVCQAGKVRVLRYQPSLIHQGINEHIFMTHDDFKHLLSNRFHITNYTDQNGQPQSRKDPIADWWLKKKERKTHENGLAFLPHIDSDEVGGRLNMWTGFRVAATQGEKHLTFLEHVRENICGGNEDHYQYLIKWMANTVQNRGEPGHVAVCLRGDEGNGKGTFATVFGHLFGRHFLHVLNPEHLVGKFNPHLETALVVFADECLWAGDRRAEQIFKGLITEPTLMIEPKGLGAYEAPNYLHLILSTNNEWVVPAGATARRYFVLNVLNGHRQDFNYFIQMKADLKAGGYASLLYFLMTLDLTGFNVRNMPGTKALDEQKALSRRGVDAIVEHLAQEGWLPCAYAKGPSVMLTNSTKGQQAWDYLRSIAPDMARATIGSIAVCLKRDWGCKPWHSHVNCGLKFPPLREFRKLFDDRHGAQTWNDMVEWQQPSSTTKDDIPF